MFEKAIVGMALLRMLSGSIEIFVAILFLKFNNIEKALILNSTLALVGPINPYFNYNNWISGNC